MRLSNTIKSAVKAAKDKAQSEGLLVTFTVRNVIGSTYAQGQKSFRYESIQVYGIYDKFEDHEIETLQLKSNDSKILLFVDSVGQLPTIDGFIDDSTSSYKVIDSVPVYVGDVPVITQVHVRK